MIAASPSLPKAAASPASHLRYRADIDGLRSLAILPVLLFHVGLSIFPGGFVGVDVFFVISGFLITSIIAGDIRGKTFSIIEFYERRIRRIFPPLFVMFFVVTIIATLLFMPLDYRIFGRSLVSASLFGSNFMFWKEGGYFDTAAELKPLLHTWSLAIEEQFYMVFPLLLYFLQKKIKIWRVIIIAIFLVSGCSASIMAYLNHNAAFYLPVFRIWELMMGSLLALGFVPTFGKNNAWREIATAVGVMLILGTSIVFTSATPFPGFFALFPCLGAALIIHAGPSTKASGLLASRPLVAIGKISYSLYLWHWPVIVFTKYWLMRELTLTEKFLVIIASFLLATLSYIFIETPFRRRVIGATRHSLFMQGSVATVLFAIIGLSGYLTSGMPNRLPANIRAIALASRDTNPLSPNCDGKSAAQVDAGEVCHIGDPDQPPTFAIIGDSFGDAFVPALDAAGAAHKTSGLMLTASGCMPLLNLVDENNKYDFHCRNFVMSSLKLIAKEKSITKVFLVGRWTSAAEGSRFGAEITPDWFISDKQSTEVGYAENRKVFKRTLSDTINALQGKQIYVVAYIPEQHANVPREMALCQYINRPCPAGVSRAVFEKRQSFVRSVFSEIQKENKIQVLDIGERLCSAAACAIMHGNVPLYSDDNHLSRTGVLAVKEILDPAFNSKSTTRL